jgi:hypothetical protein
VGCLPGFDKNRLHYDAALLRTLIRAGAEALCEHVLDEGYAGLAASYTAEDDAETREAPPPVHRPNRAGLRLT